MVVVHRPCDDMSCILHCTLFLIAVLFGGSRSLLVMRALFYEVLVHVKQTKPLVFNA